MASFGYLGLDHVQLAAPVGAEAEARRFFGGVLGMSELSRPVSHRDRPGLWFSCGVQELHIGLDPNFMPSKKAHPAIRVSDIGALQQRMKQAGVAFRVVEEDVPGATQVYIEDPFGNRIEFISRREVEVDQA